MARKSVENTKTNRNDIEICSFHFSISPPESELSGQPEPKESNTTFKIPTFNIIAQDYITILQMLWKYMNSIGSVAQKTSITNLASLPIIFEEISAREKLAKEEKPIAAVAFKIVLRGANGEEETKEIKSKVFEIEHLRVLQEFSQYYNAALRILNETALQQIINAYEKLLGELLTWYLYTNPDAAPKEQNISYKDLLSFTSLEEAKRYVVDQEIENFLKRKDTDEQLKYLKNELKADLSSHFHKLNDFKEIMLRRHAVVHAGGIASAEYMRRAKKISKINLSDINEGEKLPLSARYIINAWNTLYALGVILLHLVARESARSKKSKQEEEQSDKFLTNAAFNCIKNKQYTSAELILSYANRLTLASDTSNLMVIVNLAQTYLWQNDQEKCDELLNTRDWRAYSSTFQLCVAALRDETELFKTLLSEMAVKKAISITELCEWPVFRLMRGKNEFKEWVKEAYGREISTVTELFKPKLINTSPSETLTALIEYLDKDTKLFTAFLESECHIEHQEK